MHRSIPALLMATAAAGSAGTGVTSALAATSTIHKYTGPTEDMRWGPVQVTIAVKNKKITNVKASLPTERERSAIINGQAGPLLRQEVLQAQKANIDVVSGATMTSEAYALSLKGAIKKARKAGTFK